MSLTVSSLGGLTGAEAARLLDLHGPNLAPRARPASMLSRVVNQLRDPMILLLLGALVIVIALGDLSDGIIISAVIVLNTVIGVVQELRAATAIAALDRLSAPRATVLRDGVPVTVDGSEVVPGDVVRLEAGDVVPADGAVVEAAGLQIDEAAMTGESVPVGRGPGDDVQSGTVVVRGRALVTITRTGADSGLGRIAAALASTTNRATPLQQRLARLSRQLVVLTLALTAVVFVLGLLRGEDAADMLILAVSLAVAAIPESLPAVVSVSLAMGAYRMAQQHALVRWLPAVETLGSVSVLASDKTGTLTEGRMLLQHLWTPESSWEVSGHGYDAAGTVTLSDGAPDAPGSLDLLMRDLVLCNDAEVHGPEAGTWRVVGDPMEAALLIAALKRDPAALTASARWSRVEEITFDSSTQRMTTVHHDDGHHDDGRHDDGAWWTVCKGAPEAVLDLVGSRPGVDEARVVAERLARDGFRVLAFADALSTTRPASDRLEDGLALRGLVAISDPASPHAAGVVRACREAGIRTILITGDHPATARAIADQIGLLGPGVELVEGDLVAAGGHVDRVEQIGVYARTRPEQKVDIVAAWQRRGAVVAMTGDGVNDAPALRQADIGVAMGDRGTEVARQAADLVLADDDLRTVVTAVAEGRRIYANIRMFLRYGLSGGMAEILVILLAPFLGMVVPLAPGQILWINMLTHGVPGVAFGGEPLDPQDMARPSPSPERSVLGGELLGQILVAGSLITAISLAAGLLAPAGAVQTWVFLALGLAQLGVGLAIRSPRRGLALRSRSLEAALLLAALLQVAAVTWSPLQDLLGTTAVSWSEGGLLLGLAALPGLAVAGLRLLRRSRPGSGTSVPGAVEVPGAMIGS
ncbi:carbonate dehydratase [Nocardioides psychrotolerans]|uniref:Ca2+-transporting ATPase n=1 Tax=Nocardioides psychrotolerans TaxID=1005945 RepID=A0A1I3JZ03_9ACTN|nr:cation-translocating P-type ATPase [Nocardioides psychrotolerans]GEP38365.1 carbonate dehydratase [Nocardioides psychrotolerans]SFI65482.1 Ca2+-transporting ATPase [Nocardioides psychrotolerans]